MTTVEKKLFFLIALLHMLAFAYVSWSGNYHLADSKEYLKQAENLFQHGKMYSGALDEPPEEILFTKRTPLYPLFIGVVKWIVDRDWMVLLVQVMLSLFNIFLLFSLMKKWRLPGRAIALALMMLSISQYIYANFIMSEMLLQTFVLLLLGSFLSFCKKPGWQSGLVVSLLLIAGMMTKPVVYPLALLWFMFGLFYAAQFRKWLLVVSASIPLIFVVFYSNWNESRTGYRHFSGIQNVNLIDYNVNFFLRSSYGVEFADSTLSSIYSEANKMQEFRLQQENLRHSGVEIIKTHFWSYSWWHFKGALRGFWDPGRFDIHHFLGIGGETEEGLLYKLNEEGTVAAIKYLMRMPVLPLLLITFAFLLKVLITVLWAGLLFTRKIPPHIKWTLLFLPLYIAFATGPLNASRFMLPVLPLLVAGAAMVWSVKIKKVDRSEMHDKIL